MNDLDAAMDSKPRCPQPRIIKRHAKGTDWPVFKFRLLTVEKRKAKPSTQCRACHCAPSLTALPQHIGSEKSFEAG